MFQKKLKFLLAINIFLWCCSALAFDEGSIQTLAQQAYLKADSPTIQAQLQGIRGMTTQNTPQNPEMATPGNVLVFVSFSMPDTSLKQWMAEAQKIQAPLIIRGLLNNSFVETQAKITALMTEHQSGIVLEPRLFSDYHITEVPAVIVRNTTMLCSSTQNCLHVYPFDVVTGDVGLEAALTIIADQEDGAAQEIAQKALLAERKSR